MKISIILWDDSAERIHEMEPALQRALIRCNLEASIQINAEPPLLSRYLLIGKTPVIQINSGDYWRVTIGSAITEEQFYILFCKLLREEYI